MSDRLSRGKKMKHGVLSFSDLEVNLLNNQPYMGYQVRIIQQGGLNLIITEHASLMMRWSRVIEETNSKVTED